MAPKRDVRREAEPDDDTEGSTYSAGLRGSEPTPREAVGWMETLELIRSRLKPDSFVIVAMKLEGHSVPEIAAELGVARQTISNKLRHIEGRLRSILGQDGLHKDGLNNDSSETTEGADSEKSAELKKKPHHTAPISG